MKLVQPSPRNIASREGKAPEQNPVPPQDRDAWVHEGYPVGSSAVEHLEYLSNTAMEFVRLPPEVDLYHHIAARVQALMGESVVAVTSYDSSTKELCQRAIVGSGKLLDAASAIAGTKMRGFRQILNAEAEKEMKVGRLMRIPEGLYEALLRTVPQVVTKTIEKTMGVRAVYGMGCVVGGECFGGVLILQRSHHPLSPAKVVEAFINQTALAMQKRRAEEALRRNEERLRTLMEEAMDAYLVMTTDGIIRDVNPSACRAVGYERVALIGRQISDLMDTRELAGKPVQRDRLQREDGFGETWRMRRNDGSYVTFEARLTPLSDGDVLVIARDITDRRRLEKEVAETSRREREAIGRDLHDSLGQQLSGLSCLSAALSEQLASRGATEAGEAHCIAGLLIDSVGHARMIAQGLCLVNLVSCGVFSALSDLAEHVTAIFGVDCRFLAEGEDIIPRDASGSNLYLIAQEATTNAVRHGQARVIEIELRTHRSHGILLIRDNGSGFTPPLNHGTGMGLRIMKYRAEMIDGLLDVTSGSSGTTVKCTFPLPTQFDPDRH